MSNIITWAMCATTIGIWCPENDPIVQLPNGKIRGVNHGNYLSFESIPYAEPPIGKNRFEAPKPYSGKWLGIRDATKPSVTCIQWDEFYDKKDLTHGVEDCLLINVYTPSLSSEKPYNVLINIHGGAFMYVIVKMNYRLGVMGFLSTADEVITGNFGLKDQRLALEWTKANIAAFNGNPEKMTVIGESAGSTAVHFQMLNKRFENLATSAISFSGTALSDWGIDGHAAEKAVAVAKYLNCPTDSSSSIKKCLQSKDAADIVRTSKEFQKNNIVPYSPSILFSPVVEPKTAQNAFITEKPETIIRNGKSAEIPWLASVMRDEGAIPCAEYMKKDSNGVEIIEQLNERWTELAPINFCLNNVVEDSELPAYTNKLKQQYMGDKRFNAENYFLFQKFCTDVIIENGVKKAWALHKKYTKSPVYGYMYDNPPPSGIGNLLANRSDINFGTAHDSDTSLIFNSESGIAAFPENQQKMSSHFVEMIENFCLTGTLQFGSCKFVENSSKTKGFLAMHITNDSCQSVNADQLP
ncbi:esterase-5B-like isoform X2 [Episyrphus balteatus]|uniref:esterase-5B-like isoform X2 n=1 Tax=Episyrphus balteatus TaxID=286459 RepID=UPI00248552EB|nr:esterase-5B-like isoform X2 [Episyrphus balteatus]